jgi:hypothetical protein
MLNPSQADIPAAKTDTSIANFRTSTKTVDYRKLDYKL